MSTSALVARLEQVGAHVGTPKLGRRIKTRLAELRISGNELSGMIGKSTSYVNDVISGKNRNPSVDTLKSIADLLDCDLDYLLSRQRTPRLREGEELDDLDEGANDNLTIRHARPGSSYPLHSTNWPDANGFFAMPDSVGAVTSAPFEDVAGGYAVMVPDDANAPRYKLGEIVFVNPRRPIAAGAFVVVKTKEKMGIIREVVSIDAEQIRLRSLAAGGEMTFRRAEVETIHRITAHSEP